jgi:hypothetical protein
MRRLTLEGISPAEAAKAALAAPILDLAGEPPPETAAVSQGGASASVRGLTRAALALDARNIDRAVSKSFARQGVLWTWDAVLVPVLTGVGSRWEATGNGVDVEHLLAESVLGALRSVTVSGPAPRNSRPVLLACAPEELHTLPLHALSAALAERAIDARVLGARVPPDALAAAVRRGGACAVFIWAHCPEMAEVEQIAAVPAMRPSVTVLVGGPGWRSQAPEGADHVGSMSEAVTALQRAAGC